MSIFRVFMVPIFPHLGPHSLLIQSECGKMRTSKTPNTDIFHAVCITEAYLEPCQASKMKWFVKIVTFLYYFNKVLHLIYLTRFLIRLRDKHMILIVAKKHLENTYYQIIKVYQRSHGMIKYSLAAEAVNARCKHLNLILYSWKLFVFVLRHLVIIYQLN